MRSHISPGYALAALLESVLSLRWLPFCLLGRHQEYEYREVWGRRVLCERCGKTLEVGP